MRKRGYRGTRIYAFDEDGDYKGISKEDWRKMIIEAYEAVFNRGICEWLFVIFHDKDFDDDGSPKGLHVHFAVRFKEARTQSAVMADFCGTNPRTENCEWVDARKGGYNSIIRYLTHHSESAYNAEKAWYDHSEVYEYGAKYLKLIKKDSKKKMDARDLKESADELIGQIMKGRMVLETAIEEFEDRHGYLNAVDFTSKFETAERNFGKRKAIELKKMNAEGKWQRLTSYVSGPGQEGKSRLAINMAGVDADEYGVHVVAGGGGRDLTDDIVDGYKNEKTSVLNDVKSSTFSSRDFFNMFDRNNWSMSKSRHRNKPWFVERVYLTSDKPLSEFLLELLFYSSTRYQKNPDKRDKNLFGGEELNGRAETIEQVRMIARRVQRYIQYGVLEDGSPVVRLFRIVKEYPKADELKAYCKEYLGGKYNAGLFDLFYEEIAYIPYDNSFENDEQFEAERKRIGQLALKVFNGEKGVAGVVDTYEPTTLAELRLKREREQAKTDRRKEKERQRILVLEEKAKEYDRLQGIKQEDMDLREREIALQEKEQALLEKVLAKMSGDEIKNPFEASMILDELKKEVKHFV